MNLSPSCAEAAREMFSRLQIRPRGLTAALLPLVLICSVSLPAGATAATAPDSFIAKLNEARASHGLTKLKASTSLGRSARSYARWMLRRSYFGHRPSIQVSRRFALRGEVLARTRARNPAPAQIVNAWLDSPTHRAVLLNPRYRYIGVGLADGRLSRRPATLLVGHFGR